MDWFERLTGFRETDYELDKTAPYAAAVRPPPRRSASACSGAPPRSAR
jgi:hypothetical protein